MAVYRFWLFLFFFFLHWRLWCWMLTDTTKGTCATPAATFSFCFDSFFSSCGWNVIRPLLVFFFSSFFSFLIIWWWRYPPPRLGHDEMSLSNSRAAPVKKKEWWKWKGRGKDEISFELLLLLLLLSWVEWRDQRTVKKKRRAIRRPRGKVVRFTQFVLCDASLKERERSPSFPGCTT